MEPQERMMFQAAVGALSAVVVLLFGYMVKDHHEAKKSVLTLRKLVETQGQQIGLILGQLRVYRALFRKLKIKLPGHLDSEYEFREDEETA